MGVTADNQRMKLTGLVRLLQHGLKEQEFTFGLVINRNIQADVSK